jgi:hypothetical protein
VPPMRSGNRSACARFRCVDADHPGFGQPLIEVSAQRDNAATANLPQLQPLTAVAIIRETCSPRKESGRAEVEPANGAAVIAACRPYILRLWRRCPPKTHPMDQLLDDRSTNE